MHPSPLSLTEMSDHELDVYRNDLRELALDEDPDGPYRTRIALIEAILRDRKASAKVGA